MKNKLLFLFLIFSLNSFGFQQVYDQVYPTSYPMIGVYGENYSMLSRDGVYALNINEILDQLPVILLKEILNKKKIYVRNRDSDQNIRKKFVENIQLNSILTYGVFSNFEKSEQPYNIVFHSMVGLGSDFNIKQNIGLFTLPSGGVLLESSKGVAINKLNLSNIHYHDNSFSPNNLRFKIAKDRKVVGFWLVGLLPKSISITFNLLFNLDSGIFSIPEQCDRGCLLKLLTGIKAKFSGNDAFAIQEAIDFFNGNDISNLTDQNTDHIEPIENVKPQIISVQEIINDCLAGAWKSWNWPRVTKV